MSPKTSVNREKIKGIVSKKFLALSWKLYFVHACCLVFLLSCFSFAARAQNQWHIETIDGGTGGPVGRSPSLAIDKSGNLHLGYIDWGRFVLRYAYRGANGTQWAKMDLAKDVGYSAALAVDASGNPHFAFQGYYENSLRYASWDGKTWHSQLIDPLSVAFFLCIQIDSQGHPKISYYKRMNPDHSFALQLKYAYFDGSAWYRETVDPREGTGKFNTLALDPDGNPHIAYSNIVSYDLEYTHWDGSQWVHNTPDTRRESGGILGPSGIALDSMGNPYFLYMEYTRKQLKYAHRQGNSWATEVVDKMAGRVDQVDRISVQMDHQNRPHITYYDYGRSELKYAVRTDQGWQIEIVDTSSDSDVTPSLVLDANDSPYIAYFDETNGSVRLATVEPPTVTKSSATK
jgi:hypothetical protein